MLVPIPPEVRIRLRRIALENAIEHGDAPRSGPVVARLLSQDASLRSSASEVRAEADRVVAEIGGMDARARADALAALGGPEARAPRATSADHGAEFPDLPGAGPGEVVLRLAPFPSGALHIGHARMIYANDHYRKRYAGRLLLVFDDTPGSEEKKVESEFYDIIRGDLDLAQVRPDAVYYKSDRVGAFYPWALRTIEAGGAYVCHCPADLLRANRAAGRACPERDQTTEETMREWNRMLAGEFAVGSAVLRLRTDMQDPDPAFRDRILFRLSDLDHPRVGHRYRVWPMLEFSWAVDDLELGITHVLRGKDLVIEDRMERFLWDLWKVKGPEFVHWGILRIREAKVAKSKAYREVKSGVFDGWDDPRTWSLRSLDRRGITSEAVRAFILSFGMSLSDIEVPAESLYSENRKLIDATTMRRSFVADPVAVNVSGWPTGIESAELPNHPDRPELGTRTVSAGPRFYLARKDVGAHAGEEVRLKDLANIRLPPDIPESFDRLSAEFTSRENKRIPRLQWVAATNAVPVDLLGIEGEHTRGMGEAALLSATPRQRFQFERVGFVRLDRGYTPPDLPVRVVYGHP